MSEFSFRPEARPFPRWLGPFSPARGTRSGFRFHGRRLGTWVGGDSEQTFWAVTESQGAKAIGELVLGEWGGGRVLLLPNGFAIKPLQGDDEVGRRALIGRWWGRIQLDRPDRRAFDLSRPGTLDPGQPWPGPATTGLELTLDREGSLACSWYHPTTYGREMVRERLSPPDPALAAAFRRARPHDDGGRVRWTAAGYLITNRQNRCGEWESVFVGHVPHTVMPDCGSWIRRQTG